MNTKSIVGTGVISVSMALVATHAMAAVGKESAKVISFEKPDIDAELQAKINAAVAKKDVKNAVAEVFSVLASRFGADDISLSAKYFGDNSDRFAQAVQKQYRDFTESGDACHGSCHSACYSNCHSACHSACHGSRGWR